MSEPDSPSPPSWRFGVGLIVGAKLLVLVPYLLDPKGNPGFLAAGASLLFVIGLLETTVALMRIWRRPHGAPEGRAPESGSGSESESESESGSAS